MTDTFIFLNVDILQTAAAKKKNSAIYIPHDPWLTKTAQEFSIKALKYLN